jgi:hypothetical protein
MVPTVDKMSAREVTDNQSFQKRAPTERLDFLLLQAKVIVISA